MIRKSTYLSLIALTLAGFTFAAEVPNPAKDPNGQRVAPDGSEVEKGQSGPLAIPFGGDEKEKKNTVGVTGEIMSMTSKRIRVKDAHGKVRLFNLNDKTTTLSPQGGSGVILKKGDIVNVIFDEKTMNLQKVQIIQ